MTIKPCKLCGETLTKKDANKNDEALYGRVWIHKENTECLLFRTNITEHGNLEQWNKPPPRSQRFADTITGMGFAQSKPFIDKITTYRNEYDDIVSSYISFRAMRDEYTTMEIADRHFKRMVSLSKRHMLSPSDMHQAWRTKIEASIPAWVSLSRSIRMRIGNGL